MSEWRRLPGPLAGWTRGEGPRLVFVHGFTQTSAAWRPVAEGFAADGYEAVVVDLPGHGSSADVRTDLGGAGDLLTATCGEGVYIGYSLGGRICLHAALENPELMRGLCLVGASPGMVDPQERAARRRADDDLAEHIEVVGVATFLDEWLAQPLFAGLVLDAQQHAERLENTAAGLSSSLRSTGAGAQESLWPRLGELHMPVLTIAGALDSKYTASSRQVAGSVPNGRFEAIDGAGHAAHLQDPARVTALLKGWLAELSSPR